MLGAQDAVEVLRNWDAQGKDAWEGYSRNLGGWDAAEGLKGDVQKRWWE